MENKFYKCPYCNNTIILLRSSDISNHLKQCDKYKEFKNTVLTKEFLQEEYVVKQRSAIEIAKSFNLSSALAIIKQLKFHNIKIRNIKDSCTEKRKEKSEKRNLQKFGVRNVYCRNSPQVKAYLEKEGITNPYQSEKVKKKIKETMIAKYGFDHSMKIEEFVKKLMSTVLERYGVTCSCLIDGSNHRGEILTGPHKLVMESLKEINVEFVIEYPILTYSTDIFIEKLNTVIEIYGNYWHANPCKYKSGDLIRYPGRGLVLADDIWTRDRLREQEIKDNGYNVIVMWEMDIKQSSKDNKLGEQLCKLLKLNQ